MFINSFRRCALLAGAALIAGASATASAGIFTLEDGNSRAHFDTNTLGGRVGMDEWRIDGVNHMYNQWFWYRTDGMNHEERINSLPEQGFTSNSNFDPRPDTLAVQYAGGGFVIEAGFRLRGGQNGSNISDIAEQISISNTGSGQRHFSFFQYSDFDLNGSILDDSVNIINGNHNTARQSDFLGGIEIAETVVTPAPSNWEVNTWPTTINKLDDGNFDNLNGNAGPLVGPADYTWAYQWDFTLDPGQSFLISKDKSIVPAPGAAAVLGLGALTLIRRRR